MSKRALAKIKEYRKVLNRYYDRTSPFVEGQLFALRAIEYELKKTKREGVLK